MGRWIAAAALAVAAPLALAATYKWVDEKGVVHYTDKLPPEAVDKSNVQLDKQGRAVKQTEAAPTAEQKRVKAEAEAREKQLAKERELVERRDRALLSTYTMESEIDLARRRALATIDQQIQSANAYTVQLTKRKGELEAKKSAAKAGQEATPAVLERELATLDTELARQADLVAAKQKEIVLVNVRYDADLKRWRELRAAAEAQMNAAALKAAAEAKAADAKAPPKATTAQK
ncbi:MAG: DUF4124 domain-containing protein [Burkholderiales bacterium]